MPRNNLLCATLCVGLSFPLMSQAAPEMALALRVGQNGQFDAIDGNFGREGPAFDALIPSADGLFQHSVTAGVEYSIALAPHIAARLSYVLPIKRSTSTDDTSASNDQHRYAVGELSARHISGLVDWYVFNQLHISAGMVNSRESATITVTQLNQSAAVTEEPIVIGKHNYTLSAVGPVREHATLPNSFAPYIGIGFGNPLDAHHRFSYLIDIGYAFVRKWQVNVTAQCPATASNTDCAVLQQDLAIVSRQMEDSSNNQRGLTFSLGTALRF